MRSPFCRRRGASCAALRFASILKNSLTVTDARQSRSWIGGKRRLLGGVEGDDMRLEGRRRTMEIHFSGLNVARINARFNLEVRMMTGCQGSRLSSGGPGRLLCLRHLTACVGPPFIGVASQPLITLISDFTPSGLPACRRKIKSSNSPLVSRALSPPLLARCCEELLESLPKRASSGALVLLSFCLQRVSSLPPDILPSCPDLRRYELVASAVARASNLSSGSHRVPIRNIFARPYKTGAPSIFQQSSAHLTLLLICPQCALRNCCYGALHV